ncbi:MAG: hypothetical protein M0036_20685 [Desulfobacteraceae bacterium]|nr:hypothetical protein [Desulfobacteraceae bacterium]
MAETDTIREWVGMMDKAADELGRSQSSEAARNLLVVCACTEAAVTGFLVKKTIEESIHAESRNG